MIAKLFYKILNLTRKTKRIFQLIVDSLIIIFAFYISIFIKLDDYGLFLDYKHLPPLFIILTTTLYTFMRIGLYRAIIRYISNKAAYTIIIGSLVSSLMMAIFLVYYSYPLSIAVIYGFMIFIGVGSTRIILREYFINRGNKTLAKTLIYGAGSAGRQLCEFLLSHRQSYMPIGFIDDNNDLVGNKLIGLDIYSSKDIQKLLKNYNVSTILLAIPGSSSSQRNKIITHLEQYTVEVRTVPMLNDIISGKSKLNETNLISLEDLLERESIVPITDILSKDITNKNILITGAGGSIGSELTRQIIKLSPSKVLMIDISEYSLYKIDEEIKKLPKLRDKIIIETILGSICDDETLDKIFKNHDIDTIYHAAAYKHVPLVESNAIIGIKNNTFGTLDLYKRALEYNISSFILISTDKAVRPKSIMGCSKRLAELACLANYKLSSKNDQTKLSIVRFGNVLGSSGSVIPKFKNQIENGGPVTVTDPNVDRFFMTVNEAVNLVIQAGSLNKTSNIFILDMGKSINILTIAKRLIRLSGYTPFIDNGNEHGDIEIIFTGLREGEKLSEELFIDNKLEPTKHEKINISIEPNIDSIIVNKLLEDIKRSCDNNDIEAVKELLHTDLVKYH